MEHSKNMKRLSQLERIRAKLHRDGSVSRNQCLSQFPSITRTSARIADLEAEGYVFRAEWKGGDYAYTLLSISGVPYANPADRAQMMKETKENVAFFDNYKSTTMA